MENKNNVISVNELVNVKDISGNVIYTKTGYIISFIRVHFYNIDLLPVSERKAKTELLVSLFEGDKENFRYLSVPREIDLDEYTNNLQGLYESEISEPGRKRLLIEMLREASELVLLENNYEHQHFIVIWCEGGSEPTKKRAALLSRAEDIKIRYASAGIRCEVAGTQEIIKLCNLFANGTQAIFDNFDTDSINYPGIPVIS